MIRILLAEDDAVMREYLTRALERSGYAVAAGKIDRPAAILAVPFVAWLGFATVLAERIWRDNPREGG